MATYSLRQRERKSLHLIFSALINERNGISACCPSFQCLCRAHFAPSKLKLYLFSKNIFLSLFYNTTDFKNFQDRCLKRSTFIQLTADPKDFPFSLFSNSLTSPSFSVPCSRYFSKHFIAFSFSPLSMYNFPSS